MSDEKKSIPDYVTSDEDDDDDNSKLTTQSSKVIGSPCQNSNLSFQSDNDSVMIDDSDSSSEENENETENHLDVNWNISKIESSRDSNHNLIEMKENVSLLFGQQTSASLIQTEKNDDDNDDDDIIVLDSDGNSMLAFPTKQATPSGSQKPNKLSPAKKPEISGKIIFVYLIFFLQNKIKNFNSKNNVALDESDLDDHFFDMVGGLADSDSDISKKVSPFALGSNSESTSDSVIECDRITIEKEVKQTEKKASPNRVKTAKTVTKSANKIKSRIIVPTSDDDDDEIKEIGVKHVSSVKKVKTKKKPLKMISDESSSNDDLPDIDMLLRNDELPALSKKTVSGVFFIN